MKNYNEYTLEQMNSFMYWILSDNVVFDPTTNTYKCQCNQYVSKFSYGEVLLYWWKEYGRYEDWEEIEEIENEFRR